MHFVIQKKLCCVPVLIKFCFLGHGSSSGPSWGSIATIDEVYLRNPMEPIDILKIKDSALAESPRAASRGVELLKSKKQFNYSRLNEDNLIETTDSSSHIIPVVSSNDRLTREEPLLIDLSPDPPSTFPTQPVVHHYLNAESVETPNTLADQNRLYENYPSSTSSITAATSIPSRDSVYGSHYYSEVPIEPIYASYATPPSFNKATSPPISSVLPTAVVDEELKKKRDEVFGWLDQAMGEMSLNKSDSKSSSRYSSISPIRIATASTPRCGFEDNFSSSHVSPSSSSPISRVGGHLSHLSQTDTGGRQPFLPKPGVWSDATPATSLTQREPFGSAQYFSLHSTGGGEQQSISRQNLVQTAHVRPFMVASSCATTPTVDVLAHLVSQVRSSAPWASDSEVKQALVIHNSNSSEAVKYLKTEKLYR